MDRRFAVPALVLALAGCERPSRSEPVSPVATPQAAAPQAATPTGSSAPPAAPPKALPALPAVARGAVEPLPLELTIDRGTKPAATPELAQKGLLIFGFRCAACHGTTGHGDGPASWAVQPRPRNYTKGLFKLHTNDNGSLPSDEDLFDTITRGMGGSAMPSFATLSAEDRWALVAAVKELAVFKDEDEGVEVHFFKDRPATPALSVGEPLPASDALIAKGKAAFAKLDCNKCHGAAGDGNGPSAKDLKDDWGETIWPRNFQEARYRGVKSVRNIVERINTGLSGTPMAAFGNGQLTDEEKWGIGHYLDSLRKGAPAGQPAPDGILVAKVSDEPIPQDLRQPRFWIDVPAYEVALSGDGPKSARVSVQRDGTNLAIVVAWDDPIGKDRPATPEEFLDAAKVELAAGGKKAALEWRGEWQRDGKAFAGAARWAEGQWRVLFVLPLTGDVTLKGTVVDLKLEIQDRSAAGTKTATATAKIGVP
jgi:cytochrome c oxidase cbb3-type subunit 2